MRFEEFVLRVPGEEFHIRFHERLTVLAGVGAVERNALLDSLVGALTGAADGTSLRCIDHTGRPFDLVADGGRVHGRYADDGTTVPAPVGWFAPDAAALEALMVVNADDLGLAPASARRATDPPELAEARATLADVEADLRAAQDAQHRIEGTKAELERIVDQVRIAEGDVARRAYAATLAELERVRAEAAALASGDDGAEADRHLLLAAGEARQLRERVEEASVASVAGRAALDRLAGGATDLAPGELARFVDVPDEPPADLDLLLAAHQDALDAASALDERLRSAAEANLPPPEDPRVRELATIDQDLLWDARLGLVEARRRADDERLALGGLSGPGAFGGSVDPERSSAVHDLEDAHRVVVSVEDLVERRRVAVVAGSALAAVAALPLGAVSPVLSVASLLGGVGAAVGGLGLPMLQRLRAARAEKEALASIGVPTYLAFHMRRVDATLDPNRRDRLEVAEAEVALAARAWQALVGGDLDVDEAAAIAPDVRAYAAALRSQHGLVEELSELQARLDGEALPSLADATDRLVLAVDPYGLVEDDLVSGPDFVRGMVLGNVDLGTRARAQATAEHLDGQLEKASSRLDDLLSQLGFGDGPLEARATALEWAVQRATERDHARVAARSREEVEADLARLAADVRRLRRPEWQGVSAEDAGTADLEDLLSRRAQLEATLASDEPAVVELDRLGDRHAALERRVAALEAQANAAASGGQSLADLADVHQYLLAQLTNATKVGPLGEPVPVVLDDPFVRVPAERKWELMDLVARLAEKTQLVYLTDDAFVGAWARRRTQTGSITLLEPVD